MSDSGADLVASVVVPVRNDTSSVLKLMEALENQTLPRRSFEVLVGDDGSTDGLAQMLAERESTRVLSGPPMNSYVARNRAASHAAAPVIAFCDADCLPGRSWLEAGLEALATADLVGGHIDWIAPKKWTLWALLGVDQFIDQELAVAHGSGLGGNLFVRRALFEEVGGFDESVSSSGDYDFVQRCVAAGASLVYSRQAVVAHPTYEGAEFLRKFVRVNAKYATREGLQGRRPEAMKLRNWVPIVQPVRARRRAGLSLLLSKRRLSECGVTPTRLQETLALPLIYVVLPYTACVSQLRGFVRGRSDRRRSGVVVAGPQP